MVASLLLLLTGPQAPSLTYEGSSFLIVSPSGNERVPLLAPVEPDREQVLFRKDDAFAVWDARGLTVRRGDKVHSTRMEDVSLSPKLFSKDQIENTKAMLKSGERQRGATALSGSVRVGADCYFLLRWENSQKQPWLEALVRVNLEEDSVKPQFLGSLLGMSLAKGPISDELGVPYGLVGAVVKTASGDWGVSTFSPDDGSFKLQKFGQGLERFQWTNARYGMYQEKSSYNTVVVGQLDLGANRRRNLMETYAAVEFLPGDGVTIAVWTADGKLFARNLDSAAEREFLPGTALRRTMKGVLAWYPSMEPKSAVLLDPVRWDELARWSPPKQAPARDLRP